MTGTIELRPWRPADADALVHAFRTTPDLGTQLGGADLDTAARARSFIHESLPFGEAAWNLFRIELGHRVNNPASCRVAVRAGFVAEGVERQKLRYGDERFDVELHARLRSDPAPDGVELIGLRPR